MATPPRRPVIDAPRVPVVDTGAMTPAPPPTPAAVDDPNFERNFDRMMKIEMLKAMRGRDHTPATVPTGGAAAGMTPLKRSIETMKETFGAMKEIGDVLHQFNPQPAPWLQLANSQFGGALGLVFGKLVEGGLSAYQRRQEILFEREKLKAKAQDKPAASPGGFDLFGDIGGGSAAPPAPSSPQVVLGASERALVEEMEKKMASMMKIVEMQNLQIQSLAEQVRKTLPIGRWRFECKAEGCGYHETIAARDETEAAAAFKVHFSAHPQFEVERKQLVNEGATAERVTQFQTRWISYKKED